MVNPLIAIFLTLTGVLGLGRLLPDWLKAGLTPETIRRSRPRIEAADEFERLFGALADLCPKHLVVVVDDIDRLSPNEVLEALSSLRTFQSIPNKRLLFILTCDERIIRKAIHDANPGISEVSHDAYKAADEYLHKLFTVRQPLPPHMRQDMRAYADKLLARTNHAGTKALGIDASRTLDILIHDGVESPRHVIRLLNAFFTDYRLARVREANNGLPAGEITGRPTLLARLTVLKADFYDFYEKVAAEFALLDAVDAVLLGPALDGEQQAIVRSAFDLAETDLLDPTILSAALADLLRRTVRHVDRDRPLTPFIYFTQTSAGRILGSERAEQIRRSLENGNPEEFRARLTEGGEVANAAVDHAVATIKAARPGLPLENAVSASAEALTGAPDNRRAELATELALVIEREPETMPTAERLANVIRNASPSHQEALLRQLAVYPDGEGADERARRARVQLELAGEDPGRAVLVDALGAYFTALPEEADSSSVPGWLDSVAAVPSDTRSRILDQRFFVALATLLVGAVPGSSQSWRDRLIDVFRESSGPATAHETIQALLGALRAEGIEPRSVALGILAVLELPSAEVPEVCTAAAEVATDAEPQASPEDVVSVLALISSWCGTHGDNLPDDQATGTAVMAAVTEAAPQHPVEAASAFDYATRVFSASPTAAADALLAVLDGHRNVGDAVGAGIRAGLLAATDFVVAGETDRILAGLLSSITVTQLPSMPEAQFGLETTTHVLQRDGARARLGAEVQRWTDLVNQPASDPNMYLTPARALADATRAGLVSGAQSRTLLTRWINLLPSGGANVQAACLCLALLPWSADLRMEASTALAPYFDGLSEADRELVVIGVSKWPVDGPEQINDDLQERLVAWLLSPDRTEPQQALAAQLSLGLHPPRRATILARLLPAVPGLISAVAALDEATLDLALVESVKAGTFGAISEAVVAAAGAGPAFARFVVASLDSTQATWDRAAVDAAVTRADEAGAAALLPVAIQQLGEGEEAAMRGAVILDALRRRTPPQRPDEDVLTGKVIDLLQGASSPLAESLGCAVAWIDRSRFADSLKELRRQRGDQRAREAAEAFERGHGAG